MNYLLWNVAGPAVWPLWLACLGLAFLFGSKIPAARWALGGAVTLFLLLGLSPLPRLLMQSLEGQYQQPRTLTGYDNILVLAGGERSAATKRSGMLELREAGDRVIRSVVLARQIPESRLWIAGYGALPHRISDTGETRRLWRAAGIADERISEITQTPDTCGNLSGYADSGASGTTLLVTSAFHMPRAMACAAAAGVEAVPFPVDYRTGGDVWPLNILANLETASYALHEYAGLAYYRLSGRI
ncbi:YdcF family protein [Pacificimonas flava]|uniref:DUF218 domain-containing protein n=1 Tax=Pacificimonas flava TaxID=1234595 RepID=M2U8K5_9SPHN|nr:YdcF family protein [Pacificimonas flava]EMD84308.1 hypothetical protein C725_0238 [Pacificimonas flava]MBB5279816.1 uncharacterized SAM-binding protein YcdF (DUF218 family) [Pacificimonas flava]